MEFLFFLKMVLIDTLKLDLETLILIFLFLDVCLVKSIERIVFLIFYIKDGLDVFDIEYFGRL